MKLSLTFNILNLIFIFWISLSYSSDMDISKMRISKISFVSDENEDLLESTKELKDLIISKERGPFSVGNLLKDNEILKDEFPEFSNIIHNISAPTKNEYVQITFEFQKRRIIDDVRINVLDNGAQPQGLKDKLSLQRGRPFIPFHLELDKEFIYEEYIRLGYPKVEISSELVLGEEDNLTVLLTIKPNSKRILINSISFSGNQNFRASKLKRIMKNKTKKWFFSKKKIFQFFNIEKDVQILTKFYQENGFIDVKITSHYKISNNRYAKIYFSIDEGEQSNVDEIIVTGNKKWTEEEIIAVFGEGETFPYGLNRIAKGVDRLRKHYGKNGYSLMDTIATYDTDKKKLYIVINEGVQQILNEIDISGNTKTSDETIKLDIDLQENTVINTEKIDSVVQHLKSLDYFSPTSDGHPGVIVRYVSADDHRQNIIFDVREAKATVVQINAGMNGSHFEGNVSIGTSNLLGTGKGLTLIGQKTRELQRLGILYEDPHLFGSDLELFVKSSYSDEEFRTFDKKGIQTLIMIEKAISKNFKIGVGSRLEFLNIEKINEEVESRMYRREGKQTIIGAVSTLLYTTERKDAAEDPQSGFRIKMAMFPSHSDNGPYIKSFLKLRGNKSISLNEKNVSHTISAGISFGLATDKNTPFHEKYFAGGSTTLKAFNNKSIGNKNGDGGSMLVATQGKYSFPLWENTLKGVVFIEAASVGDKIPELGRSVRSAAGLGLKANLSNTFLGINIEAGITAPFLKEEGDQTRPFYFIIGDYDPAYSL